MAPNEKTEERDAQAGVDDEVVTEDRFAGKRGDQFAHDAHGGKDHDVDRRMRIEPEEMLEEKRVATDAGIKNADAESAFQSHQRQRDRQHRRGQDEDQAG